MLYPVIMSRSRPPRIVPPTDMPAQPPAPPARTADEESRFNRERLRAVLLAAVDAIVTVDHSGVINDVNPAAERMFGYRADEMIGRNVGVLMPRPYREEHDRYIQRYLRTHQARIIGIGREVVAQRKDGSTFPIDLAVNEVRDHAIFVGIIRDLSAQRVLEKSMAARMTAERRDVAQELHDGPAQHLTGLAMLGRVLQSNLESDRSPHASAMAEINQLIQEVHQDVRSIIKGIRPVDVEPGGLEAALQDLADSVKARHDVRCVFRPLCPVAPADNNTATQLYYIIREAVNNAVKYARARTISVTAMKESGRLQLRVADDGVGLPGEPSKVAGIGMGIMRYRASLIGATLSIRSSKGKGTVVTCTLNHAPGHA
jgi:two-component system, LuxR family, sensor kinase FixL